MDYRFYCLLNKRLTILLQETQGTRDTKERAVGFRSTLSNLSREKQGRATGPLCVSYGYNWQLRCMWIWSCTISSIYLGDGAYNIYEMFISDQMSSNAHFTIKFGQWSSEHSISVSSPNTCSRMQWFRDPNLQRPEEKRLKFATHFLMATRHCHHNFLSVEKANNHVYGRKPSIPEEMLKELRRMGPSLRSSSDNSSRITTAKCFSHRASMEQAQPQQSMNT